MGWLKTNFILIQYASKLWKSSKTKLWQSSRCSTYVFFAFVILLEQKHDNIICEV